MKTDEGKAIIAPFENIVQYVSEHIGESVDFDKVAYLSRGIKVMVIIKIF